MLFPFSLLASVTTSSSNLGADKAEVLSLSDKYTIKIAKANKNGYSINAFKRLDTRGKPLILLNSFPLNSKLSKAPAETIVLDVRDGQMSSISEIRVEGKPADIVLLSPKGVNCNGCSFVNTERVTIATGTPIYDDENLKNVKLSTGRVTISGQGLSATGASLLDIAAGQVVLDAPLNMNMKGREVTRAKTLVKELDVAGDLDVSNGDIQIIVGDNLYRYDDRLSDASFDDFRGAKSIHLTNKALITAGNVHIESTYVGGTIQIDGKIVTKGNWSYTGRYNDLSIVPLESIKVKANGNIILTNQLVAANQIEIESTRDVRVTPVRGGIQFGRENILSAKADIVAVGTFENTGAIVAGDVYLLANSIVNEGDVEGSDELYVNGKASVKNQFGGVLIGENMLLKSNGTVTNGSLYPFRILPTLARASRQAIHSDPSIEVGCKLAVPTIPMHIKRSDSVSLEAFILGNNIKIEAANLYNANPYSQRRGDVWGPDPVLDFNRSNQVIISAESTLDINVAQHFWNMSAIAESWQGNTSIRAPVIDNERYHVWADTRTYTPVGIAAHRGLTSSFGLNLWNMFHGKFNPLPDKKVTVHEQYIRVVSPPAAIRTGGNLILLADNLNIEHSAVEVRKAVVGRVTNLWFEGLKLRNVEYTETITHHSKTYCAKRVLRHCRRRKTEYWQTSKTDLTGDKDTAQFPFVFLIDGGIELVGLDTPILNNITFGPNAKPYTPRPKPPKVKPSEFIPIMNGDITFFIPNPNI